jgi:hypothetical protein
MGKGPESEGAEGCEGRRGRDSFAVCLLPEIERGREASFREAMKEKEKKGTCSNMCPTWLGQTEAAPDQSHGHQKNDKPQSE